MSPIEPSDPLLGLVADAAALLRQGRTIDAERGLFERGLFGRGLFGRGFPVQALAVVDRGFALRAPSAQELSNRSVIGLAAGMAAHLAGAMGKPVWILLEHSACWRWLTGRDDSPWYPTARLFRQETDGDWSAPMTRIERALRAWLLSRQ